MLAECPIRGFIDLSTFGDKLGSEINELNKHCSQVPVPKADPCGPWLEPDSGAIKAVS